MDEVCCKISRAIIGASNGIITLLPSIVLLNLYFTMTLPRIAILYSGTVPNIFLIVFNNMLQKRAIRIICTNSHPKHTQIPCSQTLNYYQCMISINLLHVLLCIIVLIIFCSNFLTIVLPIITLVILTVLYRQREHLYILNYTYNFSRMMLYNLYRPSFMECFASMYNMYHNPFIF